MSGSYPFKVNLTKSAPLVAGPELGSDECGARLLPKITAGSRFMALLRLYFLTDQLSVVYEIYAAVDVLFPMGMVRWLFCWGFYALSEWDINWGNSPQNVSHWRKRKKPLETSLSSRACTVSALFIRVQLSVKNSWRDGEYMFSSELSGYYIIRTKRIQAIFSSQRHIFSPSTSKDADKCPYSLEIFTGYFVIFWDMKSPQWYPKVRDNSM